MRALALLVLLASGCSPRSAPEATGGTVRGTVVSVDLAPMAYDGDGIVTMETASGETIRVYIAARMNLCEAQGLTLVNEIRAGDRIEVVGERNASGSVRPCTDGSHRLSRLAS